MKSFIFTIFMMFGSVGFSSSCPNFSGRFVTFKGEINRIYQTDCSTIRVLYQENIRQPTTEFIIVIDGKRHAIGDIFWSAFWSGDSFAREPWSAETDGQLLGDREVWSLKTDSGVQAIHQQIIHPEDGSVISTKIFRKVD